MRLAVSGTHCSGKTTLVESFVSAHPIYDLEPEPYYALSEAGVAFSERPLIADFLQQLEHSIETIRTRSADKNVIFDRSPIDFLAYLQVLSDRSSTGEFETAAVLEDIEEAIETLDLIVFLPLSPTDMGNIQTEYPALRRSVDRKLKSIVREDSLSLFGAGKPRLLQLKGTPAVRLKALEKAVGVSP